MVGREGGAEASRAAGLSGWLVEMTAELPESIPAVACMDRRVVLINERRPPSAGRIAEWLADDG